MVYTEQEFESIFKKENKYTTHVPAYIRAYPKFFMLLKLFSNYINVSNDYLETILSQLNLSSAHGAILEKIAERLDIKIEKPIDKDGNYSQNLYEEMLKLAIIGNGLKRNSRADRNSISKIKEMFNSIRTLEVSDRAKEYTEKDKLRMLLNITVTGENNLWSTTMLENYVIPKITGVRTLITYLLSNSLYFGFDRQDIIVIIGTINKPTEEITNTLLTAKAKELGKENVIGSAIKDSTGNYWVFVSGGAQWKNAGENIVEGETVVDESEGYSIQGWDKGRWAQTKVLK